jgi:hypothetical protein
MAHQPMSATPKQRVENKKQGADPLMAVLAYQHRFRKDSVLLRPPLGADYEQALRTETTANLQRFATLVARLRTLSAGRRAKRPRERDTTIRDMECMNRMAQDANLALEALLLKMKS